MILEMATDLAVGYRSRSQIARLITERWGASNLYCVACDHNVVSATPPNTKAIDFVCPQCSAGYQLKAGRQWNTRRIPDGAYATMMAAILGDRVPNLLVLQYTPRWRVQNLMLVPSFVFNASAVEKRNPLALTARRAGWTGCNIVLGAVPEGGKLRMVEAGAIAQVAAVRAAYQQLRPLATIAPSIRGWTLDVLRIVQALDRDAFSLAEVYAFEQKLAALHPGNRNVRPKIRQQLQVLRDLGLISFAGRGSYLRVAAR
jgi:type II restriction enzyme